MKRLLAIVFGIVAAGWCIYAAGGRAISSALAARFGDAIVRIGEGKIISADDFVHRRLLEAAWLTTLLLAWACLQAAITKWRGKGALPGRWNWVLHSVLAFICLNLWLSQAQHTVLFWGLMWQGKHTQNLTRFYVKLILARENPAPVQAALMGSSQTRAQIDENLLNTILGRQLRTIELHYPGSKGYDVLLMQPLVSRMHPKYIICYVSEGDFYGGTESEIVPNFLTFAESPNLVRLGGHRFVPARRIGYGLLGDALPVFRLREVLSQRVFGTSIGQINQQRYDAALEVDLAERARRAAKVYGANEESRFQHRAFEEFVARCRRSNQRVIILAGQLNPLFGDAIEPRVRQEMIAFLRSLPGKHPNVTVIENLPRQTPEDYQDLTHVTKPIQERFTRFLAEWLRNVVGRDADTRP